MTAAAAAAAAAIRETVPAAMLVGANAMVGHVMQKVVQVVVVWASNVQLSMPPTKQLPPQYTPSRAIFAASIVILILLGLVTAYWFGYLHLFVSLLQNDDAKAAQTVALTRQGDFQSATAQAQKLLETAYPGSDVFYTARIALETATFWRGDKEGRLQAIHMAREQYVDTMGLPAIQAAAINRLISYAVSAGDAAVTKEIFVGEPFQSLNSATSTVLSLRNLAELSISLYPTSDAYFSLASYHARQLVQHQNGTDKVSAKNRTKHIDAILDYVAKSDALLETEAKVAETRPFGILYEPQFFFNEGYLYGVVAFFRPEYLVKSDDAFKKVIEHFNATRDENGNTYPLLEARLPYTYLDMAIFDNEIGGKSRKADVSAHLAQLLQLVEAHPDIHKNFVAYIARNKDDAITWSSLATRTRLQALAKISPEFKEFLTKNGWEFK